MSEEQKEKWYKAFTREQLIERCEYLQRSCERKENSIMELEMEYADLEKGYCELKEKCNKGECDCTHEEYNGMCEENIKMDLDIERLNNEIKTLLKENGNKEKVIKAQDNIIKEVREYIRENMKIISKEQAEDTRLPVGSFMWNVDKVLEILDKEAKIDE